MKSYRRGFLYSIFSCISYFLSFSFANFLGKIISGHIFKGMISKSLENHILNTLLSFDDRMDLKEKVSMLIDTLPPWFKSVFNLTNSSTMIDSIVSSKDVYGTAKELSEGILAPYLVLIVFVLLFFILFFAARWVLRIFFRTCSIVDRIPVIGFFNHLLGGLFGVVNAVIILFILAVLFLIVILFTNNELNWLNTSIINGSRLFFLFYKLIPYSI